MNFNPAMLKALLAAVITLLDQFKHVATAIHAACPCDGPDEIKPA